jgi:hypothetical protein
VQISPERQEIIMAVLNGVLDSSVLTTEEVKFIEHRTGELAMQRRIEKSYQDCPASTFSGTSVKKLH